MHQPRLLLVEDDTKLNSRLARALRPQNRVDQVTTLAGAYSHLCDDGNTYDVIVLDRVLPDGDGLELLTYIRQANPETKVCITSHRDGLGEKLRGLNQGADAYLPKPLHPNELRAQVNALLRRGRIIGERGLVLGNLILNETDRILFNNKDTVRLSKREVQILRLFFIGQGQITKDRLEAFYYSVGLTPTNSLIHVAIRRLRQKLATGSVKLKAIYGLGYEISV